MRQTNNYISVFKMDRCEYPNQSWHYRPGKHYPEYLFDEISPEQNYVYDAVRNALYLQKFDYENFGKKTWNPLQTLIKPGNTVVVKPNLVCDVNGLKDQGTDCLYTHPSVVAAVIDYILIALKGTGTVIIGDAPVQECNFEKLIQESGYAQLVSFYNSKGIDIKLVDFRGVSSIVKNGVHYARKNNSSCGITINLGKDSEFCSCSIEETARMRIMNYDPKAVSKHHSNALHEYCIAKEILEADVIINMPKPKTHSKAGITVSLKNMIGVNVHKEYLPHHSQGSAEEGGDEYEKKSFVQTIRSKLFDWHSSLQANCEYTRARIIRFAICGCSAWLKMKGAKYMEGSWYGNHTISKTIIDINKIVLYADKNGILNEQKQRRMLIIADMVIAGEGEGPLRPQAKPVGIVAIGTDMVCFDEVIGTLMGMDIKKVPTLINARASGGSCLLTDKGSSWTINSNMGDYNGKNLIQLQKEKLFNFIPGKGWAGHIELQASGELSDGGEM